MKSISLVEQRKLYKAYKKARLNEAYNIISLYNTGSYSKSQDSEIISSAKEDIMNFVSIFEDKLIEEVNDELFR